MLIIKFLFMVSKLGIKFKNITYNICLKNDIWMTKFIGFKKLPLLKIITISQFVNLNLTSNKFILIHNYNNNNMTYIPKENHHSFKHFKYNGGTDSISYKYLWSPFAEWLLKFTPSWIAPNLITFFALLILIVVHIIFMLPDEGEIPLWKFVVMGCSLIIYQHLDNLDGKQARRTKTSSPLGMLFDHGSDAISAFLISLQTMKFLKILGTYGILTIFSFVMCVYFTAMWSQYCIGFFRLGRINPVDEGLPAYAFLAFLVGFFDLNYFAQKHVFATYGEQFITCLIPLLFLQLFQMARYIFKKAIRPRNEVIEVLLLYVSTGVILLVLYFSDREIYKKNFFPFYYTLMFFWARNMILIQLQFITKQRYRVFNRGTNTFLFFTILYIVGGRFLPCSTETYFLVFCVVQGLVLMEFVVSVLREGAKILDINIFSIKRKIKE